MEIAYISAVKILLLTKKVVNAGRCSETLAIELLALLHEIDILEKEYSQLVGSSKLNSENVIAYKRLNTIFNVDIVQTQQALISSLNLKHLIIYDPISYDDTDHCRMWIIALMKRHLSVLESSVYKNCNKWLIALLYDKLFFCLADARRILELLIITETP